MRHQYLSPEGCSRWHITGSTTLGGRAGGSRRWALCPPEWGGEWGMGGRDSSQLPVGVRGGFQGEGRSRLHLGDFAVINKGLEV